MEWLAPVAAASTKSDEAAPVVLILLGTALLGVSVAVAKGWALRYEDWIARTVFGRAPGHGRLGRLRQSDLYRWWNSTLYAALLVLAGAVFVIGGTVRLIKGH